MRLIQSNVPRCPKCSASMFQRMQNGKLYLICNDCLTIYEMVDIGQAEVEVTISDIKEEKVNE